jgi:hypothetical protein
MRMKDTDTSVGADDGGTARSPGNSLTRVNVNLTRKAVEALESLSDSTGYSKTDTINRAIQVYHIIQGFLDKNGGLVIKPHDSETEVKLHII